MPDDLLMQLFPGSDHPEVPADSLVEITDRWAPEQPAVITPESCVICKVDDGTAIVKEMSLPFALGAVVGPLGVDDIPPDSGCDIPPDSGCPSGSGKSAG